MSVDQRLEIFRLSILAREIDEALHQLYRDGAITLTTPAGDGRIAMVGAAQALKASDMVFGTRRDLAAAIARGVSVQQVFHQALGTTSDRSLGRGLPGTVNDGDQGVSLSDGSPATHLVHAVGFGHAARLSGGERVALALFGSAAQANGELHAALNFAAVNQTQTVFVARGPLAGELLLSDVGHAWGIRTLRVQGDDGLAVWEAVTEARVRAVKGEGPTLVDARLEGNAQAVDGQKLQEAGGLTAETEIAMKTAIRTELVAAIKVAQSAPTVSKHTLFNETYSDRPWFL
jgi:2-oxoisovalerate dehydrogenase E1 component alpha subunit